MSGPIVRKYGFPNFDKIFGKRELEHGVEEPPADTEGGSKTPSEPKTSEAPKTSDEKK
jgi:hypothetical protein